MLDQIKKYEIFITSMKLDAVKNGVEKRTISASPELFAKAEAKMKELSITNFSEYVRSLVLKDLETASVPRESKAA